MTDPTHLLKEIKSNLERKDSIKAGLVLGHLEDVDKTTQHQVLLALQPADADFVVPLLANFLLTRPELAAALPLAKEILAAKILSRPHIIIEALADPKTPFRSIYIAMAGELRLEPLVPELIDAMLGSSDVEEIATYIDTLGEIGDPQATNALSDFLYSGNRTLIIASIKALGRLGTPTSMLRLAERMGTDSQLDLLILDIFAKIQDSVSLDKLNSALGSHHAHLRTYAKKALINIGAKTVPSLTKNLLFDDPDLRIHTLNVLGDIGDPAAIAPIRKLLHQQPESANVRFAAYEALGLLPLERGAYVLTIGLSDPVEHVCIAAAKAIDRNFNEILAAGIKNIASERDEEAHRILKTVVKAQAKEIFLSLVTEPRFQDIALLYLSRAHQDTQNFFHTVLKEAGLNTLAEKIRPTPKAQQGTRKTVCAVDDSRMILSIYKSTLHELGYDSMLFEFPASALEWLEEHSVDIVLTDLNMPDITGLDLTRSLRQKHNKDELPIVMITTQNEANDTKAAYDAGVNDILHKPFTAETLRTILDKYAPF